MNRRYNQLRVPPPPTAGSVGYSSISIGKTTAANNEHNTDTNHSSDQSCDSDTQKEITPLKPPRQASLTSFRFEDDPNLSSTFLRFTSDNDQIDISLHSSDENPDVSDHNDIKGSEPVTIRHDENTLSNRMVNFVSPENLDLNKEHLSLSDYSQRHLSIYENLEFIDSSTCKKVLCSNDDTLARQSLSSDSHLLGRSDSENDSTEPQSDATSASHKPVRPRSMTDNSVQQLAPPKPFRPSSVSANDILEYKDPSQIFIKPPVSPKPSPASPQPSPEISGHSHNQIYDVLVLPVEQNEINSKQNLSESFIGLRRAKARAVRARVEPGLDPLTAASRPFSVCVPQPSLENEPDLFLRSQSFGSPPSSQSLPIPSTRKHSTSTPDISIFSKLKRSPIGGRKQNPPTASTGNSQFYLHENLEVSLPDSSKTNSGATRKISDTVNRYKQAVVDNLTPALFSIPQPTKSTFFIDDQSIETTEIEGIYYGDSSPTASINNSVLSAVNSISDSLRFGTRIYESPDILIGEYTDKDNSGYYCYADTETPRWIPTTTELISEPSSRPVPRSPRPSLAEPHLTSGDADHEGSSISSSSSDPPPPPPHNKLSRLPAVRAPSDHNRRKAVVSSQFSEEGIPVKNLSRKRDYVNVKNS